MPDDIRISDLSPVSAITNGALMELSNEDSAAETGYVSVKMTITQLATKLNVSMQYLTDLLTTNKTVIGAINEVNDKLTIGTSAPTSLMGNDGDFYLQYTEGTGGADDEVDAFYVKLDGVWCQISTGGGGGSGGHTILDNSGTALTQRTNLQFKGAYSEDNSVDDTTEVNVVRSMTKAQYDLLSAAEKVGIINITDEGVTSVGTFTPKDNTVIPNNISYGCVDKLVGISARITTNLTANSLNNIGTIDIKPNTDLYLPAVSGSGVHLGFVQITSAGNVGVYSTVGGTHGVCFSASYMTT